MSKAVICRKVFSFFALFFMAIFVLSAVAPVQAEAKTRHKRTTQVKRSAKKKSKKRRHVLVVSGDARYSDIVIDARTGRILHASDADLPRHPASLTKMMTLYITFQALEGGSLRLDQRLPVSFAAATQAPSKLGLRAGQNIRVGDAILGLVTESANDAAVVLAEALGGSESRFAQLMTRQARALGMNQTTFRNASGLPNPDQVTTARDMAALAHALVYHYPQFYAYFSRDTFVYGGIRHNNHNHLMERYDGMDGIKTGYVRASGFNLVASAERGNLRLIGVVFGGRSTLARDNQMARLLDQGFAEGQGPGTAVAQNEVEAQGDAGDTPDNVYISLPTKVAAVFSPSDTVANASPEDEETPADQATSSAASSWGIQVGAYSDPAIGKQTLAGLARNLSQLVGRSDQILQKVSSGNGAVVYRARFMGMEQRNARSICAYMVRHGQNCLVVAPGQ